jgi:protein-tyrosine phosphatase
MEAKMRLMNRFTRSLNLFGASNFRDLGGYHGHEGRQVRWRRLFRSDHLAALTEQDKAVLSGVGLSRVFDFRGVTERLGAVCALPGATVHSLPIEPTVVAWLDAKQEAGQQPTAQETARLMRETYRAFASDNRPRYRELFQHLLASDAPLVFHCTAGKDRTGFAAMLVLLALGVPRGVAQEDYLLTNTHLRMRPDPASRLPLEVLAVLHRVQDDFLDAAMDVVDQDFGGPGGYLQRGLGLEDADLARLRELYLE